MSLREDMAKLALEHQGERVADVLMEAARKLTQAEQTIELMRPVLPILVALRYTVGLGAGQMQRIEVAKDALSTYDKANT